MKQASLIGGWDECSVYVLAEAEATPHFRILRGSPDSPRWQISIKINKAEYLQQSESRQQLTTEQVENLIAFQHAPNQDMPEITNWRAILFAWNQNNPKRRIESNLKMPDYRLLCERN